MSRYNQTKSTNVEIVTNHQGGVSVKLDPKLELVSILANGFDNTYYEKLSDREVRFSDLIRQIAKKDLEFVAKALVYTRSVIGQRSVTHFGSVALASELSGNELAKRFFSKRDRKENRGGIVYRIDDMLEILACYQALNPGKPMPNSMKKGFREALENADTYELAKYQGKGKSVSLVDLVNLVHPRPSKEMEGTFKSLMEGSLKQFNTVEDKNTTSGQEVAKKVKEGKITKEQAEVELKEAKETNYRELIESKKIGYLALIRNLRNILTSSSDTDLLDLVCKMIVDKDAIQKSLVFPYQIDLAMEMIMDLSSSVSNRNKVVKALNDAYELAIPNMAQMEMNGRTAVVLDTSGSMGTPIRLSNKNSGSASCLDKGALIAATFAKGLNADVYEFANHCTAVKTVNPLDSVNTIKKAILNSASNGGTDFNSIFSTLKKNGQYDRVFIISDMQGRDDLISNNRWGSNTFKSYCNEFNQPHVYCVDLCGYGTSMFKPNSKVYQIFGYSAEMYEMAKKMEIDPKALIKEIEAIVI